MDRIYLLAPALLLLATLLLSFAVYCLLCALGHTPNVKQIKHNQFFGLFMARFLLWVLGPVERLLLGRVSPNTITALSLLMCAIAGVAAGLGHLGGSVWAFSMAGILDVLDGRLARLSNRQTSSGALFDSVSDRWGELFAFAGYAWFLHDSPWLLAVIAVMGASQMVSYTRARAEGLGIALSGGLMQRAERVFVVVSGTLLAAWYGADPETIDRVEPILGCTMLICGAASTGTALNRWLTAYRELARRDVTAALTPAEPAVPANGPVSVPEIFAPIPKALRESAELPL
ncbi:MAG: CDP-alcohol phosphatidyltransferase [Deltaproteobacteria bacterium]|nr:CDP-alcohol phosphatidyltransferase [Deltaproteobacteria bacterium]